MNRMAPNPGRSIPVPLLRQHSSILRMEDDNNESDNAPSFPHCPSEGRAASLVMGPVNTKLSRPLV